MGHNLVPSDEVCGVSFEEDAFFGAHHKTRKLSYRKDDRAMHPIYECPENFREFLTIPTATFPEIFNGLFYRLIL